MTRSIKIYLSIVLSFIILSGNDVTFSANYEWNQTDWSGDVDQSLSGAARYPADQTGWTKFYDKDPGVDTSVQGQVSISPIPTIRVDSDFSGGILSNLTLIGTGDSAYLKLTDYTGLDFGSGGGPLVIDGLTPGNSTDGQVHPKEIDSPTGLSVVATGTGNLPARSYYYRVVAYNGAGESKGVSTTYSLTSNNRSIILSWNAVACAEGYRVYGRGSGSPPEREFGLLATLPSNTTTWEDKDTNIKGITLTASTSGGVLNSGYKYYQITGYKSTGEETVIARGGVSVPSTTTGRTTITWTSVPWATSYRVYGRPSSYNYQYGLLTPAGVNSTTWTDTGSVTPDTTKWPVEANVSDGSFIVDGEANYTDVSIRNCGSVSASKGSLMVTPSNVSVTIVSGNGPAGTVYYIVTAVDSVGNETSRSTPEKGVSANGSAVNISWGQVAGAAGYKVYRRSSAGTYAPPSLVCTTSGTSCIDNLAVPVSGGPPIDTTTIPTPSYTRASTGGAITDGNYYYELTAVDAGGRETTPGSVRSVTISYGTGTSSVTLSWTKVSEAIGYRIYRTTTSGLYNNPALVCKIDSPNTLSCQDTLSTPQDGVPPRSYLHALSLGNLKLKVSGALNVDSTSRITVSRKGYPGGANVIAATSLGNTGKGPGAAGDRGAGAGYAMAGGNNSAGTGNVGYPYGEESIIMPNWGSGGASGSTTSSTGISGKGGAGGGVLGIFARSVDLRGEITSDGEAGGKGVYNSNSDGGGGGAGGTILVGMENLSVSGSTSARGGGGGSPFNPNTYIYLTGGTGSAGRIRLTPFYPVSGVVSSDPVPFIGNKGVFESASLGLDSGGVDFQTISWNASLPTAANLKFQIATNNDNSTWSFVGPDGTSGSYYQVSGDNIRASHDGDRFIKYRAYFESSTVNPADSPVLYDVTISYSYTNRYQRLVSSPFDTTDTSNSINRWLWFENIPLGSDVALQIRSCPGSGSTGSDPCPSDTWDLWLGPHSTTFSAPAGINIITAGNTSGLTTGGRVTLTDASELGRMIPGKFEIKKIVSISGSTVTLDSNTGYTYGSGSILTDLYTDPNGTEAINSIHRDGTGDRWLQYKVYLFSDNAQGIPVFLESLIEYQDSGAIYQPDGVIDSNGNNIYASSGTGGGGSITKSTDMGTRVDFNVNIQNDGTMTGVDDKYIITWNLPSDVSGIWKAVLSDGTNDYSSPFPTPLIPAGGSAAYTLKVTPSPNAPASSTKDVIVDIRSESDYAKTDSIKASVNINTAYLADGLIDGVGDNLYDPNQGGGGGTSTLKEAGVGDTVLYYVTLQNEGNISDAYTLSLLNPPPSGWTVLINDGSKDTDITNPTIKFTTPSIPPPPYSGSTVTYTLKVIPSGLPTSADIVLNIYSNGGLKYPDSLTARLNLGSVYKVDGVIYGYGYDMGGVIKDYGVLGSGCGTEGPGDNIYGAVASGNGGCTVRDIAAGSNREITIGLQNEGNVSDKYQLSWNQPAGWGIVMQEILNDGSTVEYSAPPVEVPTASNGNPLKYNRGEMPFFIFKITAPTNFTSGSQTIIFDINSLGDTTKVDSVKAVINSSDTTPPASVYLSTSNITATSVKVSWTAPGDDGTTGTGASYDLRYSTSPITDINFAEATKVIKCRSGETDLRRPGAAGGAESCTVSQLYANTSYYFALKTTDDAGNTSALPTPPAPTCSVCPAVTLTSSDAMIPINITDLTVTDVTKDKVTLCWTATTEDGGGFFDDFSDGTLSPWSQLQSGVVSIADDGGNNVLQKTVNADPNGGWAPLSQTVGDFDMTLYTKRLSLTAANFDRYSLSDAAGNGYGLFLNFDDGNLYVERRSVWSGTVLGTASPVSGGLTLNQWYTLNFKRTGQTLTARVYLGRVEPSTSTPLATVSTSDGTYSSFTQVNVNGGYDYNTDDVRIVTPSAGVSSEPATGYILKYSPRYIVDSGPSYGEITFSDATTITPEGGWLPPKNPGEQECYIVSVKNIIDLANDIKGISIKDDRTNNTRFYFAIKALDEAYNKSFISNVAGGMTALTPYAYNMVSVPYVPDPDNPQNVYTPQNVFGDDVGAPLYVYHWDSRGPNITNGCYDGVPAPYSDSGEVCSVMSSIKTGNGYFLWAPPKDVILDAPSASTQPATKSCVYDVVNNLSFTCYELLLQDGWNMIGIPFDSEINLSDRDTSGNGSIESAERGIYVRKTPNNGNVDVATFQTAVTARNWIDNDIFTYNGINYTYEICDQDTTGSPKGSGCPIVGQPWKAYWIRADGGGGATLELLIPQ